MSAYAPAAPQRRFERSLSLHLVPPVPADPIADLTPRERQVLSLMAEGRSNHGICKTLFISPKTLERHVQHVFTKLGLPPSSEDHRRVRAVLAWLDSPLGGGGT